MRYKLNKMVTVLIPVIILLFSVSSLLAHCQIPCGIYNDEMRIKMIEENITTIEKSMNQIVKLSTEQPVNYNQLIRWISNKEEHANKIQEIVYQYFLTQRIKPVQPEQKEAYQKYLYKLSLLHQLLFYAMKTKQTTDLSHVEKLRSLLSQFTEAYFGPKEKEHLKEHH